MIVEKSVQNYGKLGVSLFTFIVKGQKMSNLATRVLFAVIAIPVFVFVIIQGGWLFALTIALLAGLGAKEFFEMSVHKAAHPQSFIGILFSAALPVIAQAESTFNTHLFAVVLVAMVLKILAIELFRNKPNALLNVASTIAGIAYVGGMFTCLVLLSTLFTEYHIDFLNGTLRTQVKYYEMFFPTVLMFAMFISIWVCDSAAYFAGMAFGKHKMFPRVSPKKSWEGWTAGFIASAVAFWCIMHFFYAEFPAHHAIIIGALIGIIGPLGDFAESLLKRDANIKDSSNILPGHGGILDRFDSVLFVAPMLYVYFRVWILLS